eukprot:CAMPEP_0202899484 /NCGR_PEP_ID=MMETSP1392-20130828/7702_1 /ASSEMBLY_ACC=CAM_ASM_000868 /TAXON_ID=225041 /ORGANISM="Chlamydomonas chlamydogama, Strain SAG 11-48b" /LENGTH=117 /DNA_ID=CAMNT_0049585675 /DNA_START=132 /DNA_END=485 /DNA_ORIENTATION=-
MAWHKYNAKSVYWTSGTSSCPITAHADVAALVIWLKAGTKSCTGTGLDAVGGLKLRSNGLWAWFICSLAMNNPTCVPAEDGVVMLSTLFLNLAYLSSGAGGGTNPGAGGGTNPGAGG